MVYRGTIGDIVYSTKGCKNMTYTFKCKECGEKKDIRGIPVDMRNDYKWRCTGCGSRKTKRIVAQKLSFHFAEDLEKQVSTKSDRYWQGAEKNRLKGVDDRRKDRFDRVMQRDPETIEKLRSRATNRERLGNDPKVGDPALLQEAKEIRQLIGDEK